MTSNDVTHEHRPMILLVGGEDCLDRDCEEYVTEDGDDDPGVERCSHIHEETVCVACTGEPNADGHYERVAPWTADHSAAPASS